jgi:hypothetical protein
MRFTYDYSHIDLLFYSVRLNKVLNQAGKAEFGEAKRTSGIIIAFHEDMKGMADAVGRRAQCVVFVMWF